MDNEIFHGKSLLQTVPVRVFKEFRFIRKMIDLVSIDQFKTILKDNKYVVLDLWASWCGPCKKLAPLLTQIEKEVKKEITDFVVCKANIDNDDLDIMRKLAPRLPTLRFYLDGKEVSTMEGGNPGKVIDNVNKLTGMELGVK